MKRFFFTLAAIAAAFTLTTSCEDVTDEQKDGLTKVLLAGEYGVISMTNVDTDEGFDEEDFIYEDGKPRLVWVLNLDGTQYMAYNRVWKKKLTTGTWDVSGTTFVAKTDIESAPENSYEIVSFDNNLLTLQTEKAKLVLKRLAEADKYAQLQSISFTDLNVNALDGKVHLDPKQSLTQDGHLQLSWVYDPEGYDPFDDPVLTSSDESVATVSDSGVLTLTQGVTEGETTITVRCDYVETSVTLKFYVIN